jgi:Protein of unknown function (DUF3603)
MINGKLFESFYTVDVVVNWFSAESGIKIHEWFSWQEGDAVELLDRIPTFRVTPGFFNYVEEGFNPLPKALLEAIEDKTVYVSKGKTRRYAFAAAISDGERSLVFKVDPDNELEEEKVPDFKSRLKSKDDMKLLSRIERIATSKFSFKGQPAKTDKQPFWLLTKEHIGLTRRESRLKQRLLFELSRLSKEKNSKRVAYFYTMLFPHLDFDIVDLSLSREQMIEHMEERIRASGWNRELEDLGTELVKFGKSSLDAWYKMLEIPDVKEQKHDA